MQICIEKLFGIFAIDLNTITLDIILPLGISFYTFQALGYVIDVYKKEVKASVSGIYITDVRGFRVTNTKEPEKKKGFFKRTMDKVKEKAGAKPL